MQKLPPSFDTFRLEKKAGEYKDFNLPDGDPYPLKGVTYPVDYGDIAGYLGEDGHNLDIFLGRTGEINGYILVSRPDLVDGEHKFYVNVTESEEKAILNEFGPTILGQGRYDSMSKLLDAIQKFAQRR
jgi:hypothetical protein